MKETRFLQAVSSREGYEVDSVDFFIVVLDGEIEAAYEDESDAEAKAEKLSAEGAYAEEVIIEDDIELSEVYITLEDDELTYRKLFNAYRKRKKEAEDEDDAAGNSNGYFGNYDEDDDDSYDDDDADDED